MCYRYTLRNLIALHELLETLGLKTPPGATPRFNVALTQRMPVVIARPKAELTEMVFGFSPPPRTTPSAPSSPIANARAETLLDKPSFRDATAHRRCLIPADGFYEWEKAGRTRLPHYFHLRDDRPFYFAGLWQPETTTSPAAFTIVTTTPNALIQTIHDRMPVILGPNSGPAWLGAEPLASSRLTQLTRPLRAELMTSHRVHPRMNHTRYEAPDCAIPCVSDSLPLG